MCAFHGISMYSSAARSLALPSYHVFSNIFVGCLSAISHCLPDLLRADCVHCACSTLAPECSPFWLKLGPYKSLWKYDMVILDGFI